MSKIFEFENIGDFLDFYLKSLPKRGHGKLSEWASALSVSPTLLSQIFKGKKSLSLELAEGLAELMNLGSKELDYFLLMVQIDRAGTYSLRERWKKKLKEIQVDSRLLKNRIEDSIVLPQEIRVQYYSSWIYSGIRNLVSCGVQSVEEISDRLMVPRSQVVEVIDFLERNGLIKQLKKGWEVSEKSTYLSSDSALVIKHHQNWRMRSMQKMELRSSEDLFYTSPLSLSESVARQMRKYLVDFIEDVHSKTESSSSEKVRCFILDWFEF